MNIHANIAYYAIYSPVEYLYVTYVLLQKLSIQIENLVKPSGERNRSM